MVRLLAAIQLHTLHEVKTFPSSNNTTNFAFILLFVIQNMLRYYLTRNNHLNNLSLYLLYESGFSTLILPNVSITDLLTA